jgi:diguanylate cyclase (GGDEF)-like protein
VTPARRPAPERSGGLDDLLEAMERAQDLAVGDPRVSKPAILVDRILGLLRDYTPGVRLHAQFFTDQEAPESGVRLLPPPVHGEMPLWWRHRLPGQSLWIPDDGELPTSLRRNLAAVSSSGLVTAVVPLIGPAEPYAEEGLVYVSSGPSWSAADLLPLARRLSSFVTRRWRCQLDVNRRVLTDALTGIHNRAFFDTQFLLELERSSRAGLPLTLVIADLDDFKSVNDQHGHQCGDLVLRGVAQQLQARLRRIDHVCRIGGEEFGCLLPATSLDEARDVLSRVVACHYRVAMPAALGMGALDVTISYGAVTFPAGGQSASELHRKADRMLYQAKELGRNRCCLWIADGHYEQLSPAGPATGLSPGPS